VQNRLSIYHAETEPLIGYYKNKNLLVTVDGQQTPAEVTASVKKVLGI
jgi:adenylate kinase